MTMVKIKKAKGKKKCAIKRKLNFQELQNCLEAIHHENKINYLEKNKINRDSLEKIMNNSEETKNQYQK